MQNKNWASPSSPSPAKEMERVGKGRGKYELHRGRHRRRYSEEVEEGTEIGRSLIGGGGWVEGGCWTREGERF